MTHLLGAMNKMRHEQQTLEHADDCECCCDHEYDPEEGNECLNCGKDGTEALMARAETIYEGDR